MEIIYYQNVNQGVKSLTYKKNAANLPVNVGIETIHPTTGWFGKISFKAILHLKELQR